MSCLASSAKCMRESFDGDDVLLHDLQLFHQDYLLNKDSKDTINPFDGDHIGDDTMSLAYCGVESGSWSPFYASLLWSTSSLVSNSNSSQTTIENDH